MGLLSPVIEPLVGGPFSTPIPMWVTLIKFSGSQNKNKNKRCDSGKGVCWEDREGGGSGWRKMRGENGCDQNVLYRCVNLPGMRLLLKEF